MSEKKTDIWEQRKKELFSRRFSTLLEEWKKKEKAEGRKGTQEAFIEKIGLAKSDSITDYKKGKTFPEADTMQAICKEFGVSEEIFYPIFDFEKGADKGFLDEKSNRLHEYCDSIGLNESLVSFITSQDRLQTSFPLHSSRDKTLSKKNPIVRTDSPFQITDGDGDTLFLESSDLDYLKELQSEIETFIRFKFFEELQAMRKRFQDYWIEHYTSHTDLKRDDILSRCSFKEICFPSPDEMRKADMNTIANAVRQIQEESGKQIAWHWKQSEIDSMFSHEVDTQTHKANLYSGLSEEELEAFYAECDKAEEERKAEYIKSLLENGDVIDNG